MSRSRVTQCTVLSLRELNSNRVDRWQHTIEAIHEDVQRQQLRVLTDVECQAPEADEVAEALLSSLMVRRRRRLGVC